MTYDLHPKVSDYRIVVKKRSGLASDGWRYEYEAYADLKPGVPEFRGHYFLVSTAYGVGETIEQAVEECKAELERWIPFRIVLDDEREAKRTAPVVAEIDL